MKRLLIAAVVIAIAACTATVGGHGGIEGRVSDTDGAPLPGVTITAVGPEGQQRTTVSDAEGFYAFERLVPGSYVVTASLAGMGTSTTRVAVKADRVAAVRSTMSVPAVTEAITVTAEAPRFSTAAAARSSLTASNAYAYDDETEIRPRFRPFEEHGFIEASKQGVTTFAIDVDRASYSIVRGFLSDGELPPADAVRVEEMLNYFTWDYPQPAGQEPFSITTEVAGCPWNTGNRLLRIGIQGRNLEQWRMAPNNLVFLLDVSGSMDTPVSLPLVKQAFRVLVDQLRAEDRVAIVVYAGAEGLALPSTSGADKQTILDAIDNLQPGGSTAGAAGIELAYKVAQQNFLHDGNNRVILATDGDFNVGVSSLEELELLIEEKRKSGVFLSTIGVGEENYQDGVMETLADKGNGNYAFLDSLREAEKVFKHELTGTLVTIAKDVKVQLEFDPSTVQSYRQIGYENRALANEDFEDDSKDAGELGAGHSVTALYEIVPRGANAGNVATIRLRYKEPNGWKSRAIASAAVDQGKSVYEASPDMQFAAAIAEVGMLLRNSPHVGSASWEEAAALARMSRGADLDGTRGEFGTLVESAKLLTGGADVARR